MPSTPGAPSSSEGIFSGFANRAVSKAKTGGWLRKRAAAALAPPKNLRREIVMSRSSNSAITLILPAPAMGSRGVKMTAQGLRRSGAASKALYDFLELRTDLLGGLLEALIIDSLHRRHRVDRRDLGLAAVDLLYHDVAGKHCTNLIFDL